MYAAVGNFVITARKTASHLTGRIKRFVGRSSGTNELTIVAIAIALNELRKLIRQVQDRGLTITVGRRRR